MRRFRIALNIFVIAALLFTSIAMFIPIVLRHFADPYTFRSIDTIPHADVALVLGASVRHGRPSPVLEERAHTAVQLYVSGKVKKILVTGDNGALTHDEVTPVRKYLIDAGIPPGDVFLDHAGFDTYSSMYRARDVFRAQSVIIVTQDFHLPRAVFIARELGLTAYGIDAKGGGTGADYLREVPASLKALWDLLVHRMPKYLGEQIPLTGDGSETWY